MQRIEGELVLSPTDLTKHLACGHITTLDLDNLDAPAAAVEASDRLELIFRLGLEHEAAYLEALRTSGKRIVEIPGYDSALTQRQKADQTIEAMQAGADVVFQGVLSNGGWTGIADFLIRIETPSAFGAWSYEIADTKLARHLKVPALLQLATYAERLEQLQGIPPAHVYVVTGDSVEHPWRLIDVSAYARRARARLRAAVTDRPPTEPVPVMHCSQCRWEARCASEWRRSDDLSRVAFMRADHRLVLRQHGITTVAALATTTAAALPAGVSLATRERLVAQAFLQMQERADGLPHYELLPPVRHDETGQCLPQGLLQLPPPNAGDVYLDFEGDPFANGGEGLEYLAGLWFTDGTFQAIWAHSPAEEAALTSDLVDLLLERWERYPGMHVYHYAPYEVTALKRLTARHNLREVELDRLLRGERFVDLYAAVRQGLRISKESYSIKKMEAFYWGKVRSSNSDVADALDSVVAYEKWTLDHDQQILDDIEAYNKDDVESAHDLHKWLEERRTELVGLQGELPRPGVGKPLPETAPNDAELAEVALAARLLEAGQPLLAGVVSYHRRESRPAYWELFHLERLDDDELLRDSGALGGLSAPVQVGLEKRSQLYRYEFPIQETKVRLDDAVKDVDTRDGAGTVFEIDATRGFVVIKRQGPAVLARGFTNLNVVGDDVMRIAIAAVAQDRMADRPCLGSSLLDRVAPKPITELTPTGIALAGQVLAVQGPPGTGKTTDGAALIRALLDAGKVVGVTAPSHAVIGNLLKRVGRPGLQKCDSGQHCGLDEVISVDNNAKVDAAVADGATLIAGTAWLWARPKLANSVDVLVIDEAGQFSLANAIAASNAARSMVLLGDPQQLPQPLRAEHPPGVGLSVLAHILDEHATMPPERGIFLDTTHRLHPDITSYISDLAYDGRLHSGPGQELQAIDAGSAFVGSGLRVRAVEHVGNSAGSPEEVAAVSDLWHQLVAGSYTDRTGTARPMTADDVLIVAPYNVHVGLLRAALPTARIGTVDKFQGQQAPVVIYTMASSSCADAPRGVAFLYDVHRLNVAVSRAQAMAIVVCSPTLLDAPVHTPEDLRAVNALCWLAEIATAI